MVDIGVLDDAWDVAVNPDAVVLTYFTYFLFTHATPRSASARLNVCVQHKQLNG